MADVWEDNCSEEEEEVEDEEDEEEEEEDKDEERDDSEDEDDEQGEDDKWIDGVVGRVVAVGVTVRPGIAVTVATVVGIDEEWSRFDPVKFVDGVGVVDVAVDMVGVDVDDDAKWCKHVGELDWLDERGKVDVEEAADWDECRDDITRDRSFAVSSDVKLNTWAISSWSSEWIYS